MTNRGLEINRQDAHMGNICDFSQGYSDTDSNMAMVQL